MPTNLVSRFSDYLSGTGILDAVTDPTVKDLRRSEPVTSSQWGLVLPVLGAIALGALAWHFLGREPTQTATAPTAKTIVATADEAKPGSADRSIVLTATRLVR